MKVSATLLPLALIACSGGEPITLDTGEDVGELPTSIDFESGKVSRVVVETVNGNVNLQPGGDNGGVRVDVIYQDQAESWDYFLQDQVLEMWPLCENGVIGCSSGFSIGSPATMAATIYTVSGEVTLTDYVGDVTIDNDQGTISGVRIQGGNLVATGLGVFMNIAFAGEPTSVDLTTLDGTINLTVPRGTYTIDIETNGIRLVEDLIDGDGPLLLIRSTSGDITVTGVDG
jgi:DUF4097 and DUF4098 domain-containing protein YvlB